jgi:predicted dinucleotide-binding enzyme
MGQWVINQAIHKQEVKDSRGKKEMKIAIIGAGHIGGTLGKKWAAAGHTIRMGVRDANKPGVQELVQALGKQGAASSVGEAIAFGEIVVFAIPGAAMDATIATHAAVLDGKIIIDAANKVRSAVKNSQPTFTAQTPNAQVFRAFNALGWENFENPMYNGVPADLFFSGPEGGAREKIEQLIADVGLRPVYLGGPEQVGLVDDLLSLWFTLVTGRNLGRNIAFKLLQRD